MRKTQARYLLLNVVIFVFLVACSCKKEDPNASPGKATLTSPSNNATDVALNSTLTWQAAIDPDGDAIVYDVYFGAPAPVIVVSANQEGTFYTPDLMANTSYVWRVVAKDPIGATSESELWNFRTLNNGPGTVDLTSPANAAANIALDEILTWQAATDPDGDAVVYDLYFGTDASPETLISADQEGITYAPTLTPGTTYYWKVIAKDPNGGTSESAVWSFTTIIQIGDFFEGGVVFYIDETGKHGLVCPIIDTNPVLPELHGGWGCNNGTDINGAGGTAIGTGQQNTLDILAACPTEGIAADMCAKLVLNGYSDWFLPSINELGAMKQNKEIINAYALAHGGAAFTNAYYYSSSEKDSFFVLAHGFYAPNAMFMVGKGNLNYPFRAVRAF